MAERGFNVKEKILYAAAFSLPTTITGAIAYILGGWTVPLVALFIIMGIDYITGIIVAAFGKSSKTKTGTLSSWEGAKGLFKKCAVLAVVAMAAQLDTVIGAALIRDGVIFAYLANEAISITENVGLMGVKIPPRLMKAIDVLKSKSEDGNKPNDT